MSNTVSPRLACPWVIIILAGFFLLTGNLLATTEGYSGNAPQGVRYTYVKMTPEKEALIKKIKSQNNKQEADITCRGPVARGLRGFTQ